MQSLILFWCLLILSVFPTCEAKDVAPGISYQKQQITDNTVLHILTLDPKYVKIIAARAQQVGVGFYTVNDIAKHFSALAAINGGFFRHIDSSAGTLLPAGVLKINNSWHGIAYKSRGAIGWDENSNKVLMDILQTETKLNINKQPMPINAINKILVGNKATLLSDSYTGNINLDNNSAIVFKNNMIDKIYTSGDMYIPSNAYAYVVNKQNSIKIQNLKIGDSVALRISALPLLQPNSKALWNKMPFIVGGGPLIIKNNTIITDFAIEKLRDDFVNTAHARTAVGILDNNNWVFVVVEGGVTIHELSKHMQSLGCVMALNLDGGGSSAMYVADQDLNLTSGRPVADALLVIPR